MLTLVVRKMLNNKWLVACLLIGSVLTAAMVSSIPMYTRGILQRMLTRDLENSQKTTGYFPGFFRIKVNLLNVADQNERIKVYRYFDNIVASMYEEISLPSLTSVRRVSAVFDLLSEERPQSKKQGSNKNIAVLDAVSGLQEHVKIISGSIFSSQKTNDVYEVIISQEAAKNLDLVVGKTYQLREFEEESKNDIKVKIVGVFTVKDGTDPFWYEGLYSYSNSLLMDYSLFYDRFIKTESDLLTETQWYYALDYRKITLGNIKDVISTHKVWRLFLNRYSGLIDFKMACIPILEDYYEREKQLKSTLWILQVPILIMLAFYIFMVSQLIIQHERNEIAVLKSRGASRLQIFMTYLLESIILSGITIVISPPLGMFICSIMGASNGFLEFVQRAALRISLNGEAYLYALLALLLFVMTMLVPALLSSKDTIVQYKQSRARSHNKALWKRFYLDFVLLAAAGYGFYRYGIQKKMLVLSGIKGTDVAIDPLLFLTSTFFVLGAGLVFLRIFPYAVRLVFTIGKKVWSPIFYASFIHVGRSGGQEQFLMLFIIFTLSTGIFNANAARTINRNALDRVAYETGADITLMAHWDKYFNSNASSGEDDGIPDLPTVSSGTYYVEPYFEPFTKLASIEAVTKVFRKSEAVVSMPTAVGKSNTTGKVSLMGIIPDEFGRVSWLRNDLLPYHWYNYLNLMTRDRTALLLSRSFQKKFNIKEGDPVSLTWTGQGSLSGIVYAFIDYWPSYNPYVRNDLDNKGTPQQQDFVVANLAYIQNGMALEPYEVWMKKKPGISSAQVYKELEEKGLTKIDRLVDAGFKAVDVKNDPMLQGTNGSLTLGFIITILISTVGFLIYWILSIKQRFLQFGILRAMGLSKKSVIGMLLCEQALISGTAVIVGVAVGKLTSMLFIRLFEVVYSAEQQLLPFKVVEYRADYLRLYAVVTFMLITCFAVLGKIISRIKINQVIKLGED